MSVEAKPETVEVNRDQQIHFRVTATEKKAIAARAAAAGYRKVSDYLRELGMGAPVKEAMPAELRRQLVGLGTSLHQLAHLAQTGQAFRAHEAELRQALSLIRRCLV
ncbi:MobC domain-containing protein [Hymenobacter tenuis]